LFFGPFRKLVVLASFVVWLSKSRHSRDFASHSRGDKVAMVRTKAKQTAMQIEKFILLMAHDELSHLPNPKTYEKAMKFSTLKFF
jgi:hypothetical protein